jgi:hypothetical protein
VTAVQQHLWILHFYVLVILLKDTGGGFGSVVPFLPCDPPRLGCLLAGTLVLAPCFFISPFLWVLSSVFFIGDFLQKFDLKNVISMNTKDFS